MKIFMRDWVERVLDVPKNKTLDCGCPVKDGSILSVWREGNVEHYGVLCDKHFYEYNARIVTGVDNGRD